MAHLHPLQPVLALLQGAVQQSPATLPGLANLLLATAWVAVTFALARRFQRIMHR